MLSTLKKVILGDYLPIYVINRRPVLFTAYWSDFFNDRSAILSAMPEGPIRALCMLGWHRETDERADELVAEGASPRAGVDDQPPAVRLDLDAGRAATDPREFRTGGGDGTADSPECDVHGPNALRGACHCPKCLN